MIAIRMPPCSVRPAIFLAMLFSLSACAPRLTPTVFVPPTQAVQLAVITATPSSVPPTVIPTLFVPTPTPPCADGLTYLQDLTIPDSTAVSPGQAIDKQWLVTNSGTCDWDGRYRLKLVNGDALGALTEQALYPARAGTQATLRILFAAPQAPGAYQSAWQAVGPDGAVFGDAVYIQIIVQ
jgi:Ig-like domain-containing protein